jgi:hypothetical protein
MSRFGKSLALLCALAMGNFCAGLTVATAKPLSPIEVSIEPVQTFVAGEPVAFEVRARVNVDAQGLVIQVDSPPGMVLHSGELSWRGDLPKGHTQVMTFTATLPADTSQPISVRAVIEGSGGSQLSSIGSFDPRGADATTVSPLSHGLSKPAATTREGRPVVEYELER